MFEAWYFSYDYESKVEEAEELDDYNVIEFGTLLGSYKTYDEANEACKKELELKECIALIWDPNEQVWK